MDWINLIIRGKNLMLKIEWLNNRALVMGKIEIFEKYNIKLRVCWGINFYYDIEFIKGSIKICLSGFF